MTKTLKSNQGKYERIINYDESENVIGFEDSRGVHIETEYDEKRNITHCKDYANGYEFWNEYDEKGNLLNHKEIIKGKRRSFTLTSINSIR